jgi:hypothetical protein
LRMNRHLKRDGASILVTEAAARTSVVLERKRRAG